MVAKVKASRVDAEAVADVVVVAPWGTRIKASKTIDSKWAATSSKNSMVELVIRALTAKISSTIRHLAISTCPPPNIKPLKTLKAAEAPCTKVAEAEEVAVMTTRAEVEEVVTTTTPWECPVAVDIKTTIVVVWAVAQWAKAALQITLAALIKAKEIALALPVVPKTGQTRHLCLPNLAVTIRPSSASTSRRVTVPTRQDALSLTVSKSSRTSQHSQDPKVLPRITTVVVDTSLTTTKEAKPNHRSTAVAKVTTRDRAISVVNSKASNSSLWACQCKTSMVSNPNSNNSTTNPTSTRIRCSNKCLISINRCLWGTRWTRTKCLDKCSSKCGLNSSISSSRTRWETRPLIAASTSRERTKLAIWLL